MRQLLERMGRIASGMRKIVPFLQSCWADSAETRSPDFSRMAAQDKADDHECSIVLGSTNLGEESPR